MIWKIKPLDGKYYGTKIENERTGELIEIWLPLGIGGYRASNREIEEGWCPDHGFDHTETQRTYDAAYIICNALNEKLK